MIREAIASKVPVHVAKSLPLVDERLRETGSGRDGAHGVANTRGRQQHTQVKTMADFAH